jgi:RNA polymerase sigma-70 factor (ECF subfamily)
MLYVKNVFPKICTFSETNNKGLIKDQDNFNILPEKVIWDAFRKGNDKVFSWLYKTYSNCLVQYGCKLTEDKKLVEDCLQDFYLYLREKRNSLGETKDIKPYLIKSFRRRLIEYIKKKQTSITLDAEIHLMQNVEPCAESNSINKETNTAQLEKLSKALKSLNQVECEAIYYFYYEGLGYEKIAEIFNFSHISSARRVIYRSLKQLRLSFQYS